MLSRCPACATVFRVDTVQLRAREGRVRCGRCHTVFDAVDAMVELPLPKASDGSPPDPARTGTQPGAAADSPIPGFATPVIAESAATGHVEAPSETDDEMSPGREEAVRSAPGESHATLSMLATPELSPLVGEPAAVTTRLPGASSVEHDPTLPRPGESMDDLLARSTEHWQSAMAIRRDPDRVSAPSPDAEDPDATQPLDIVEAEPDLSPIAVNTPEKEDDNRDRPAARDPLLDPPPVLEPVRDPAVQRIRRELYGEEEAHRRSALATALWTAGILLLLLLASAQLAYLFRTELVIAQPALKAPLQSLCARLGCSIPAPRRADLISIEASELNPDATRAPLLRLNAQLRNGAAYAQDWPNLELTLTDTGDRPVARRVLVPGDYLPAQRPAEFAAMSEQSVSVLVDPTDTGAGGYRLYVFYP